MLREVAERLGGDARVRRADRGARRSTCSPSSSPAASSTRTLYISGSSPSSRYPTPQTFSTSVPRPCLAELAPKARGVRVERPRPCGRAVVPHLVQQLLLREHTLGLARELNEQLVLLLREMDPPAADTHVAGARVDAHRPRLEQLRRPSAAIAAARHECARRALGSRTVAGRSRRSPSGTRGRGRPRRPPPARARSPVRAARTGRRPRCRPRARGRSVPRGGTSRNPSSGRWRSSSGSLAARSNAADMRRT